MKTWGKLVSVVFVASALCALSACSTTHQKKTGSVDSANDTSVSTTETQEGDASNQSATTKGAGESAAIESEDADVVPTKSVNNKEAQLIYYFGFDRYTVNDKDKAALKAQAEYLLAHTKANLVLEGHTDPRGSREYNIGLGERRAKAVEQILINYGVDKTQIRTVSYGDTKLAVPGHTAADYKLDRRVVLVYKQ